MANGCARRSAQHGISISVLAVFFFASIQVFTPVNGQAAVRVCIPFPSDATYVRQCSTVVQTYLDSADVSFSCVAGASSQGCINMISNQQADLTVFGGDELYSASTGSAGLQPFISEIYGRDAFTYYSVAVVRQSWCAATSSPTLASLEGMNACSTGYRKTAGWTLPFGHMLASNAMPTIDNSATVNNDAESVAAFFGDVCSPRTTSDGPTKASGASTGSSFAGLCNRCNGDCSENSTAEPYNGYEGAMQCMLDGADVAFVKHTTALDTSIVPQATQGDLRLLCKEGGCQPLSNYGACNLGLAAAHAFVGRPGYNQNTAGAAAIASIVRQGTNASFLAAARQLGGQDSFLLSSSTTSLQAISTPSDFSSFFGASSVAAYASIRSLTVPTQGSTPSSGQVAVRICIPFASDSSYVQLCNSIVQEHLSSSAVSFSCVAGASSQGCTNMISNQQADLTVFGGDELYSASTGSARLQPFISEMYGQDAFTYYSVAVVRQSWCAANPSPTLASLKGVSACSTGYRKTAGWTLPFGHMLASNTMPPVDSVASVNADAESVAAFFGTVCSPRTTSDGPTKQSGASTGSGFAGLCDGCKGDCSGDADAEPYNDYEGAMQCMLDGAVVAFVKHATVLDTSIVPQATQANLRLLCKEGGCQPLTNYGACNLGVAAAHAFVGRPGYNQGSAGAAAIAAILAKGTNVDFLTAARRLGGQSSFLLSPSTTSLQAVSTPSDFSSFFGASSIAAYSSIRSLSVPAVRYCTASADETAFCNRAIAILNAGGVGIRFTCVQMASDHACLEAISAGQADMRTVDAGDVYTGSVEHGLKVIVAEDYSNGEEVALEYYAVAVVDKGMCGDNAHLQDLKGKRSCHTGYHKTAGWYMPVGLLMNSGIMPVVRKDSGVSDDAESVASFFSSTCAPRVADNGPMSTSDGQGQSWDKLCTGCRGDCGQNEPYGDYPGAFRCLVEDEGDVSFVKHTTALEYSSDGTARLGWSTRPKDDFRLLCPSGGCATVDQYQSCNIARVPSHAVIVRSTYADADNLKAALVAASDLAAFRALVFNGVSNPSNYFFKSGTRSLEPWNDDTSTFLGNSRDVFAGLATINAGGDPVITPCASSKSSSKSGYVSPGAAVGIAFGCAAAGALIAILAVYIYNSRKQPEWEKYGGSAGGLAGKGEATAAV